MRPSLFVGWAALGILAICCGTGRAELPPRCYPDPNQASEVVDIEVLSAWTIPRLFASDLTALRYKVYVKAKVRSVNRTTTGLQPGAKITLTYDAHSYYRPYLLGRPGSFPVLAKGDVCMAHLFPAAKEGCYTPTGAPYSAFVWTKDKKQ